MAAERFGSYSFVGVPTDGPLVPAVVLDMARAAVRDGVAETLAVHYDKFHYELVQICGVTPLMAIWVIQRWSLTRAQMEHGLWPQAPPHPLAAAMAAVSGDPKWQARGNLGSPSGPVTSDDSTVR